MHRWSCITSLIAQLLHRSVHTTSVAEVTPMSRDNTMVDMRWAFMLLGTNPVSHTAFYKPNSWFCHYKCMTFGFVNAPSWTHDLQSILCNASNCCVDKHCCSCCLLKQD